MKCDEQASMDYEHLAHGNHMMDNGSLNYLLDIVIVPRVKSRSGFLCLPLTSVSLAVSQSKLYSV